MTSEQWGGNDGILDFRFWIFDFGGDGEGVIFGEDEQE
jgi:hypothetical protein